MNEPIGLTYDSRELLSQATKLSPMQPVDLPTVRQPINYDLIDLNANAGTQVELAENDTLSYSDVLEQPYVHV